MFHSEKVLAPCILPQDSFLRAFRRIALIGASYPESKAARLRRDGLIPNQLSYPESVTVSRNNDLMGCLLLAVFHSALASARRLVLCVPEGRIAPIGASNRRRVLNARRVLNRRRVLFRRRAFRPTRVDHVKASCFLALFNGKAASPLATVREHQGISRQCILH